MAVTGATKPKKGVPASGPSADGGARRALRRLLLESDPGRVSIDGWTRQVGDGLLAASPSIGEPNFTRISPGDLSFLFEAYDTRFMEGLCAKALGPGGLSFRLSRRMTRTGGKTTRLRDPDGRIRYEIAIGASILFDGFRPGDPDVTACGLPCRHRLDALQRVFEHELVHLAEYICWDESSCARPRFQGTAERLFLHRAHTHRLITRRERAARMGIRVGTQVTFHYRGRRLEGRVNRITKRATVLVDDPRAPRWSDGRRYARYYVPLEQLHIRSAP